MAPRLRSSVLGGETPGEARSRPAEAVIDRDGLGTLIDVLRRRGYRTIGPRLRDGAIVYDEIASAEDLPEGWTDEQEAGTYRLRRRGDGALFGYSVGPDSWKRFLFPPRSLLWRAHRTDGAFEVAEDETPREPPLAFIGVRGCELAALAVQDRVFLGAYTDPLYTARRSGAFIVAASCAAPSGTCFCVSMGTGPRAGPGFDLALTELLEGDRHAFLVEMGSDLGAEVLGDVPSRSATPEEREAAVATVDDAARRMGRRMRADGIRDLLCGNLEHPRWDDVASRCLACANCTMVCPTCFCSTVEDSTGITGGTAERWRRWDSCFTLDHSALGPGHVRSSARSRYRQWMTHKLATWIDQFGTSGCVGCGRCITWCPAGIDITEEVRAIRTDVEARPATRASRGKG